MQKSGKVAGKFYSSDELIYLNPVYLILSPIQRMVQQKNLPEKFLFDV